jgi:hypothetical protein
MVATVRNTVDPSVTTSEDRRRATAAITQGARVTLTRFLTTAATTGGGQSRPSAAVLQAVGAKWF